VPDAVISTPRAHDDDEPAPSAPAPNAPAPARVAMHGTLLRWNEAATADASPPLLAVFRLSDVRDAPPPPPAARTADDRADGRAPRAPRTSSLFYAALDGASLHATDGPLSVPRRLRLPSPPTAQLLSGPEDGRLFRLNGRIALLYNDVLPELPWPPRGAAAARAARWRMRRGLYLTFLSTRADGDGGARGVAGGVADGVGGVGGVGGGTPSLVASRPIALRPSQAALAAAGAASDVEKNWVPFEHNHTLYLSYALDPHLVLRVAPAVLAAAVAAAAADDAGADALPREVTAELAYATRFEASPARADGGAAAEQTRPQLRGGTPPLRVGPRTLLALMHTVVKREGKAAYAVAAYSFGAAPPFAIEAVSRPLALGARPTPYPLGLVHSADASELLLSYGVADREWHVARLSRAALLAALVPVRTEALPLPPAASDGGGGLPTRLHFARSAPEAVRAEVVAHLQGGLQ
jgi:hypothetical protein